MQRPRTNVALATGALVGSAISLVAGASWALRRRRSPAGAPTSHSGLHRQLRAARTVELAKTGATASALYVAHQAKRSVASDERREELDAVYQLRSAEQVADALGNMKGVLMKLGQMASYLNEAIPEHLRDQLASLQADAPPMSPDLARGVVESELGGPIERFFAEWDDRPLAAASIGQVHCAVRHDGRRVAVKVQYPGVETAISADLKNTAFLTQILSVVFRGLDTGPFLDELRLRVSEELDYRLEADRQRRFFELFDGHPVIVVPRVHDDISTTKVLVSDLSPGERFAATAQWTQAERDLAGEAIYRFVFRSFNRHRLFNGDPHPGNYLFERTGPMGVRVTFLDFGLVKHFTDTDMATFWEMIRTQVIEPDPDRYRATVEGAGLLLEGAPFSTEEIGNYFGYFYHPILADEPFTYTSEYAREALKRTFDLTGDHTATMRWFNMPPSFVVLNRIQWGLNAVLASLSATANWRAISEELWPFTDRGPTTPMGELEHAWLAGRAHT